MIRGMEGFALYAAIGLTVASTIQALVALSLMRETELDVIEHWQARDELRAEFSWWKHPMKRRRRSREIKRLIDGSDAPEFRRRFRRLRWSVLAWILLVLSFGYGVVAVLRTEN